MPNNVSTPEKNSPVSSVGAGMTTALPGARAALVLLLLINLFNYIDRQVLAAVVPQIKESFFGAGAGQQSEALQGLLDWCRAHLGFRPENA